MTHTTFVTWRCSSRNQFDPKLIRSFGLFIQACSSYIVGLFFKSSVHYTGSLDKCHTSAFNALICECLTRYFIKEHQEQTAFENIVGKEEIARKEQFLLFPLCFLLLNQIIVSPFVHIFDIIFSFAAK